MSLSSVYTALPTHERTLRNGLRVLVREDHSAPVVAVLTHVRAGYFDEPDSLVGISHVLEHMYFKGTERRGPGDMARETKALGGYLNAGTIYHHTTYYTVLPSAALPLALDIQADALRHSVFDADELRRELGVIVEEAKRKLDRPHAVAAESLYGAMFDVHRIRRWRIGSEEGLRRLRRDDVVAFHQRLYRPGNIVLVVSGDVSPEEVFARVDELYGDAPAGDAVRDPSPVEPPRRGFRFRGQEGDIVQSHLEWGWRAPDALHPDTPLLHLVAVVLGQGRASRLYREVRERGLVTSIGAYALNPGELGIFSVSAELRPERTDDALEAIALAVARLRRDGPRPEELERARSMMEARLLGRLETMEGQARMLAEWEGRGSWRLGAEYLDRIAAATPESLRRVAGEYLAPGTATVFLYRPRGAPAPAEEAALLGRLRAATTRPGPRVEGAASAHAASRGAGPASPRGAAAGRTESGVHHFRLPGGVRLVVEPRPSPLVAMALAFPGGKLWEEEGDAGITGLMARSSLKGTRNRSAAELAEQTEALGGALSFGATADYFQWALSVPGRHFARAFHLLADAALRAVFPEAEVERERAVALADLDQVRDDMVRYPSRLFLQAAFEGHPYGFPLEAVEAGLRSTAVEALRRWHGRSVLGATPTVVVVGGVDPAAAARQVEAELAGELTEATPHAPPSSPVWPGRPRTVAVRSGKAQTALMLGFPGPRRGDPAHHVLRVVGNALSGLGGRLFEELRSRRSLGYSVAAYPLVRAQSGAFVAYIGTSPEREDEARRALVEELERAADEGIGEAELARSREFTVGTWEIRGQTNGARLSDLVDALLVGGGVEEVRSFVERVRAVEATGVRELLGSIIDPTRLVEGVVRGGPG